MLTSAGDGSMLLEILGRKCVEKSIQAFQEKKRTQLLESIRTLQQSLDAEVIQSEPFISAYLETEKAIEAATTKAKVDFLILLYTKSLSERIPIQEPDLYHEFVNAISPLSDREIYFLVLLDQYSLNKEDGTKYLKEDCIEKLPKGMNNKFEMFNQFNEGLAKEFEEKLGLDMEDISRITSRLESLGLLNSILTESDRWPRVSKHYKRLIGIVHFEWERYYSRPPA